MHKLYFYFIASLLVVSCSKEQKPVPSTQSVDSGDVSFHSINADSVIYSALGIDTLSLVHFYKVDLNNDGFEDLIILQNPPIYENDPGAFSRLTIHLTNIGAKHFDTQDVFDKIPDTFRPSISSSINSEFIGVYPFQDGTLVFAFGFQYGSGMAESMAIKISENSIVPVFEDAYNSFISLSELEFGQTPKLVLRKTEEYWGWIDSLNIALSTYSPFHVFILRESFELDSLLTKKYNMENYVFQGFETYNPNITVAVPRDGSKPYIYRAN